MAEIEHNNTDLACKVWAVDITPSGEAHNCHANQHGLKGNTWIGRWRLEEELSLGASYTKMNWQLRGCKPNDDGSNCVDCCYKQFKGVYSD
ncbi:MAG: hypothetical protein AABW49_03395 [Nanoarchaeota archaeon]